MRAKDIKKQTCSGLWNVHGLGVNPKESIGRMQGVLLLFRPDDESHALLHKLNL